jgi:hypothetical protein
MSGVPSHLALYLETLGKFILLDAGVYLIGRSSHCDLCLDGPGISRKHARLVVTQTRIDVVDLRSKNGTFVNDEQLAGTVTLGANDTLRIGRHRMTQIAVSHLRPYPVLPNELPFHGSNSETTATNITATAARVLDLVEILAEDLLRRFAEPNTIATITTAIEDLLDGAGITYPPLNDDELVRLRRLIRVVASRTDDPEIRAWESATVGRLSSPDFSEYAAC